MHNAHHGMPRTSIIAVLGERTRAIGKDNALLWHIPGDLPRVKHLTMGHPLIMGSRTFASIGHALPGRTNIVVTHDRAWSAPDVIARYSVEEALATARSLDTDEVFVFGGGSIYAQLIEQADRLYLTLVEDDAPGDTFFPEYRDLPFVEVAREEHVADDLRFAWVTYDRRTGDAVADETTAANL